MSQQQYYLCDVPKYDPIPNEQALEDALWGAGDVMYWLIRLRAHQA